MKKLYNVIVILASMFAFTKPKELKIIEKGMTKPRLLLVMLLLTFSFGGVVQAQWVSTGLTNGTVNIVFETGGNLFAGLQNGALISTNNGTNWNYTTINSAYGVWSFGVIGTDIFAGTTGGLFRSTDNGLTWNAVNSGMPLVQSFALIGTNFFAGTEGGGVYLSTDNGNTWTQTNNGLTNLTVRALLASGSNLFAGTNGSGVFLSTDNGLSWNSVNNGITVLDVRSFAVLGTYIFAGTIGSVFRSGDNGANWNNVHGGWVRGFAVVCDTDLYAGQWYNGGGVDRSTDNGTTWTSYSTGLTTTTITSLAVSGSNLFAGTWGGGVFSSTIDCIPISENEACITWDLLSSEAVSSSMGNITGQDEIISQGSTSPFMSVYDYNNGQRLWVGNTGWPINSTEDPTRYIEFNASPQSGNSFTVNNVSFNYGDNPLNTDFNILESQVYYSTNNWSTQTLLNSSPLTYLNTTMQSFNVTGLNAFVGNGQSFSLRIFPYSPSGGVAMTPTFGIHNNVIICGTTGPDSSTVGSICGIKFNDLNGNGVKDLGEPGLPDWEINIKNDDAPGSTITTTDENGNYCFDNLTAGTYTVSENNQSGWQQTSPVSPGTHIITLTSGQQIDSVYFGNQFIGIEDSCSFLCNSDFEDVQVVSSGEQGFFNMDSIPCWNTTTSDSLIEVWGNGFNGVPSYSGNQFIELNAKMVGTLYQDFNSGSGGLVTISFAHRGRVGWLDSMSVSIGPLSGTPVILGTFTANDTSWTLNSVQHNLLTNTNYVLSFISLPTGGTAAGGNFLDAITIECPSDTVGSNCDLLGTEAIKTSPDDCNWSLSLLQPNDLTGITSIQILCLLPNQFTTGTGLGTNYQDWFISGSNTFTPPNGIVPGGNLNDFFNMSLSYVTSPQIVIVNWLDDSGEIVCAETVELDCEISCTTILSDTLTCNGSIYSYSYSFTNNADYSISSIDYTLQTPSNVSISPLTSTLSLAVSPGSNSILQNIQIMGAAEGDTVSILAKFNSPDGCCWCYETITLIMPSCITVCDSLSVEAQGNPEDCCYSISLTNNSSMEFSHVEFELVSGGMFSTFSTSATGWGFTNAWPNNLIKLRKFPPFTQTIGQGTFSDVLDMCIRDYTSPNQVVAVRWMKNGEIVCTDTLMFECTSLDLQIDSCSQANNGTLICLPNGTFLYKFRVQNNSSIMSTGYGIYPTTPGVTFSKTLFENINIMPGQVSPLDSIIISGIGGGEELCFQTAIFNTVVPGESVYNFCCHSEIFCITTPDCGEPSDCVEPPTGMVGWWSGDGNTDDISGLSNHGILIGNSGYLPGKVAQTFVVSNSSDYILVPDNSSLNFGRGNFSIDAWVKTTDDMNALSIANKFLINNTAQTIASGYVLWIEAGKLGFLMGDGSASALHAISNESVSDGMWHFVAVTVDRNNTAGGNLYIDGNLVLTFDPTTKPNSTTNTSSLILARVNAYSAATSQIDEIEIFNRNLTQAEIQSIYEAGSAGKCKTTTDVNDEEQIPKKIELMQSYPNPFNPSTTIRYNLSKAGFVKLIVYDILGREVKVLVNEGQNPGQHSIIFDAQNLSSGIYIYTLRTGDFNQSKKMILMK